MARAPKTFRPVAATANALDSGVVVYRAPDGSWSRSLAEAEIAETPEAAERLRALAEADRDACRIVELDLIEIVRDGAFLRPASLRELIRTSGPTIPLPRDGPPAREAPRSPPRSSS